MWEGEKKRPPNNGNISTFNTVETSFYIVRMVCFNWLLLNKPGFVLEVFKARIKKALGLMSLILKKLEVKSSG